MFSPHWGRPDYGLHLSEGSFDVKGFITDNEDPNGGTQKALIYFSPWFEARPARLTLDGCGEVFSNPKASVIILNDNGHTVESGYPAYYFYAENMSFNDLPRVAVVEHRGKRARGRLHTMLQVKKAPLVSGNPGIAISCPLPILPITK